MRRLPADAWCRRWTAPIVLLVVAIILALALACNDSPAEAEAREIARSTSFWVTLSMRNSGPYAYKTREPIELPDGSRVVCVATLKDLWCRDAK